MPGPDARTPDNGPGEMSTATAPTATVHSGVEAKTERKLTVLETHGYTLGRTIGSGSYATVKVAKSDRHNCNVAIKIISKFQAPGDYLKKFLPREIEVVKGLKHENLIRFLQAIETTHRVYIVMEYAENGSLLDIIRKDQHIDEIRGRRWFRQLVEAVDYCHERGVVHRDIKCENLLMDHGLSIKLSDFGFARGHMKPKNGIFALSETFCGSYAYASPEILKGVPYRPQDSDIWSMGVVLYAIVYGRLPFDDTNYTQLLKQVQNKVSFPREPRVSAECRKLVTKILAPLKIRVKIPQILADPWLNPTAPPAKEDTNDATEQVKYKVFTRRQTKLPLEGQKLVTKMFDMLKINVKIPQLFPDLKFQTNPQSGKKDVAPEVTEKLLSTLKKIVKIPRYLAELWLSPYDDEQFDEALEEKPQYSKEEIKSANIGTLTFDRKLEEVK